MIVNLKDLIVNLDDPNYDIFKEKHKKKLNKMFNDFIINEMDKHQTVNIKYLVLNYNIIKRRRIIRYHIAKKKRLNEFIRIGFNHQP